MEITVSFQEITIEYHEPLEMTKDELWIMSEKYRIDDCSIDGNVCKVSTISNPMKDFPIVEPIRVTVIVPFLSEGLIEYLSPFQVQVCYECSDTQSNASKLNISGILITGDIETLEWIDFSKLGKVDVCDLCGFEVEGFTKLIPHIKTYEGPRNWTPDQIKLLGPLESYDGTHIDHLLDAGVELGCVVLESGTTTKQIREMYEKGVRRFKADWVWNVEELSDLEGLVLEMDDQIFYGPLAKASLTLGEICTDVSQYVMIISDVIACLPPNLVTRDSETSSFSIHIQGLEGVSYKRSYR